MWRNVCVNWWKLEGGEFLGGSEIVTVYMFKNLVANATGFNFLFHRLYWDECILPTYSNFAGGLLGGVDVKWSGELLVSELHWRSCG